MEAVRNSVAVGSAGGEDPTVGWSNRPWMTDSGVASGGMGKQARPLSEATVANPGQDSLPRSMFTADNCRIDKGNMPIRKERQVGSIRAVSPLGAQPGSASHSAIC